MSSLGVFSLIFLGFALGLRHGIDWDHIAAITDITGSVVASDEAEFAGTQEQLEPSVGGSTHTLTKPIARRKQRREIREGFLLATMYALGHASLVVVLGLLALWIGAILPDWIDPIMERIVGVTLIILGIWIFYSIWRYGRSFQLRSRWMLVFSLVGQGWENLKSKLTGRPIEHSHSPLQYGQYGPKTAFGIGVIHGVGAETGSQAILLASAAGATTKVIASMLLFSFTVGLLLSNSLVAAFSLAGFISASTKRNVYVVVGVLAGIFSLFVGFFFVTGLGTELPDLQELLNGIFGSTRVRL